MLVYCLIVQSFIAAKKKYEKSHFYPFNVCKDSIFSSSRNHNGYQNEFLLCPHHYLFATFVAAEQSTNQLTEDLIQNLLKYNYIR